MIIGKKIDRLDGQYQTKHRHLSLSRSWFTGPKEAYLHLKPTSAALRGLPFRLLPFWRKPLGLLESTVLESVSPPFSSLTKLALSLNCVFLFLLFPPSAMMGLFGSFVVIPLLTSSPSSSSSAFSASSSSNASFSSFWGLPLLFWMGIFSSSWSVSSWLLADIFLPFPRPLPIVARLLTKWDLSQHTIYLPGRRIIRASESVMLCIAKIGSFSHRKTSTVTFVPVQLFKQTDRHILINHDKTLKHHLLLNWNSWGLLASWLYYKKWFDV